MVSSGLGKDFFDRSVLDVAKDMLGVCICCRKSDGKITRMIICETEAYDGEKTWLVIEKGRLLGMK